MIIRGTNIYVEDEGDKEARALLFLHGGPGEGCLIHSSIHKDQFKQNYRWVSLDQRGVLRSESLHEDEDLKLVDLVHDLEEIRIQLQIEKWVIWGHSFGGLLALLYERTFPDSVISIVFECPSFDFDLSLQSLLQGAAEQFKSSGNEDFSLKCRQYSRGNYSPDERLQAFLDLGQQLPDRSKLYIHNPHNIPPVTYPQEIQKMQGKSIRHLEKLRQEGKMYDSLLPVLSDITVPTLLIKGAYDLVTCSTHVEAYQQSVSTKGKVLIFNQSGHNPSWEESVQFSLAVSDFIKETYR
ncbi:alpha/beta fold hydrolase [Paenibacillus ginsengarvi]|uniref:prolyl aminopeptidase n=1 Tax=Paenibacillus ginsengarvi TaxID=400777 RepID=A0A3B0BDR5_9BACL|nr:alpha/beta hydrolase [Paenibacillus ginsengarvi]RKN70591.1 alpha/beta hydrolase [Paenibacillus ginsengarvi]